MLKTEKLSNDRFQFKNSIIFKFIFLGIGGLVAGYFLIQIGLDGNWREMNEETVAFGLGILAVIGGICSLIFGPQIHTFIFDKAKNKIFYNKRKLTGSVEDSYPLDEVEKIIVTTHTRKSNSSSSGSNKKSVTYKYRLLFSDQDLIELAQKQRKKGTFARMKGVKAPKQIKELSEFLDVEIKTIGLKESLNNMMDAITGAINKSQEDKQQTS